MIVIVTVDLSNDNYTYLIQILNEKYYSTTNIAELQKINNTYMKKEAKEFKRCQDKLTPSL